MEIKGLPKLKFESSWDDGDELDHRVIELLKKYKLPGTFYLPGHSFTNEFLDKYDGFEIGGHTVSHPPDMKTLDIFEIRWEIAENKKALEVALGHPVTKFCYPRGRFDDRVIQGLKDSGFIYARTTVVLSTLSAADPFRTATSIHVFQRKEYGDVDWMKMAEAMVQKAEANQGIFHIWGHSWEIHRDQNWDKLDAFFSWLTENYEIIKG